MLHKNSDKNNFHADPFSGSAQGALLPFAATVPSYEEGITFEDAVRSRLYAGFARGALAGFFLGVMIVLTLLEIPGLAVPVNRILFVSAGLGGLMVYFVRLFAMLLAEQK